MDLSVFTPEQIEALRAMLANPGSARSPLKPRQLHDLRLLPTKDDPRPTFFWSVESPRDDGGESRKTHPYPRLMWSPAGEEIRVENVDEHRAKEAQGYTEKDPGTAVYDPADAIRAMLEALSPADRALVIDGQRKARIAAAIEQMGELSDADVERVVASFEAGKAKKSA